MGRSHGMHGEPITLGLKFALWYDEMKRNIERLNYVCDEISYGKFSGSMGTYTHMDMRLEKLALDKLDLLVPKITNQIISRDRHAEVMTAIAITGSTLDKIATEIRHLQRTEVGEVEEPFLKGQKGSSSMPHKHNPIQCENICGLSRILRANVQIALENVALWHERDISHSSNERFIFPDSTMLLYYMLNKMVHVVTNLKIDSDRMRANMRLSKGIYKSQNLLLAMTAKGIQRNIAYEIIQDITNISISDNVNFIEATFNDNRIKMYFTESELIPIFDDEKKLYENVTKIFDQVFKNNLTI